MQIMERVNQDVRYGLRLWRKTPGVIAAAIISLGFGIGANTAVFSVINALLIRPLPYKEADRLFLLRESNPRRGRDPYAVAPSKFMDWRNENSVFAELGAFASSSANLTGDGEPERVQRARVSSNFFAVLGVEAGIGRTFSRDEQYPTDTSPAVLSDSFWKRRFNSDRRILGAPLWLDGQSFQVIGVMPRGFQYPAGVDVWIPWAVENWRSRTAHALGVIGRLRPDVPLTQAQAEMNTIAQRLAQEYPETDAGWGITIVSLRDQEAGKMRLAIFMLFGAALLVLLIACANVADLLLARAVARKKEIAIRAALGAAGSRLIRQTLTESILLSVAGGIVGLFLAYLGLDLLLLISPESLSRLGIGLDLRVLSFALGLSIFAGIVFGLAPAFYASKVDLSLALKEGGCEAGRTSGQQLRFTLVVLQIGLATVLLTGTSLLINSFIRVQRVNAGFNPENVLTMRLSLSSARYSKSIQRTRFCEEVLERIEALPGVQSAGVVASLPLAGTRIDFQFQIEGYAPLFPQDIYRAEYHAISQNYLHTMGIPLLKGRTFTKHDSRDTRDVALVSETFVRQFLPSGDPIGKRLSVEGPDGPWLKILGVVGDVKDFGLEGEAKPEIYAPYSYVPWPFMAVVVRTASDPLSYAGAVQGEIWKVDKEQPVFDIKSMEQRVWNSVAERRFLMLLLSLFAGMALLLAAVGIFGVMSYSVSQRVHEIGVRMAIGADPGSVLRLIMKQGMRMALIGTAVGFAGSLTGARLMTSMLFQVSATDPLTLGLTALVLFAVAMLACYIPAVRAMEVDPMVALRHE